MADSTSIEARRQPRGGGCGCGCMFLAVCGLLLVIGAILVHLGLLRLELPGIGPQPGIGKRLSTVDLVSLGEDREVVTPQDLEGKVVVLNFWGTWCPPCRLEMPEIAELEKKFGGRPDFRLLAVSCGQGIAEDVVQLRVSTQAFLRQTGLDVPVYADPDVATRNAVNDAAGFSVYPTTLILDRKGVIRGVWTGYSKGVGMEMEQLVERLLEEKAGPPNVI